MSEPILNLETAVRELGALPMPTGLKPQARTMLDHARAALRARMAKDDLRLVLENTIVYTASLQTRVAELEARLAEYERPADEDPITYALTDQTGVFRVVADLTNTDNRDDALYAAERVEYTLEANGYGCAVSVEAANAPLTIYRASHDSIPMGLYTTAAEARKHCEAKVQQEEPAGSIRHLSWWTDDIGDDAEYELHITPAETGARIRGTGYVVAPVEIAAEHDEEADE